tara:strand:- start:1378 stop:1818 length:441 start_codon:yes stop_codon:yes gene_type:complete
MNASEWLKRAIVQLNRHESPVHVNRLHELTRSRPTEMTERLIREHPSLVVEEGYVSFVPFCDIGNQLELVQLLSKHFPRAYRRTDLQGLYKFIEADIDELLFTGTCTLLDKTTNAISVLPPSRVNLSANAREVWHALAATNDTSFA